MFGKNKVSEKNETVQLEGSVQDETIQPENEVKGTAEEELQIPSAADIVKEATANLKEARAKIVDNIKALTQTEDAIQQLVREQVNLPTEIQITALVSVPAGAMIKADKTDLDCVLMGMAKGQIISRDGAFVLIIKERIKSLS